MNFEGMLLYISVTAHLIFLFPGGSLSLTWPDHFPCSLGGLKGIQPCQAGCFEEKVQFLANK